MKRVLSLFLVAIFLVSVWGCVAKTKHDELLEEKTQVEKRCEELLSKEAGLRDEITARRQEIINLQGELRSAKAKVRELDRDLAKLKTGTQD